MLDTDQLRSFLAIVDFGSFTRAAERVNKTQSAVSMHVRRLEEQLGCALFAKQGRGARLTREGEDLIPFARRIVEAEASALAALSRKGLRGAVRLGIPDDYAEAYLAGILTRFSHLHPLVEISATCENSQELASLTQAGALDIALVTYYDGLDDFETIREEPLAWCASPKLKLREGEPIPIAQGSLACVWRRATEEALGPNKHCVRPVFISKNFTAIGAVARAGLAATVLPIGMIGEGLRILPADCGLPPLPDTSMGLIFGPGAQSEETKALAQAIRDSIPALARLAA
jgi:DNA-binding transcriptional LysR family regulator